MSLALRPRLALLGTCLIASIKPKFKVYSRFSPLFEKYIHVCMEAKMYERFLFFMFGILIGTGIYSFLEVFGWEMMIIPLWSFVIIGLFVYDRLFKSKN
jgi:hypothetical protein